MSASLSPESAAELEQLRERVAELEARYLPKLCECGHSRLVHTVPSPHSCFAGDIRGAEPCDCGGYRQLPFAEAERRLAERHAAKSEDQPTAYVSRPLPARDALCGGCGHTGADHHHAGSACWAYLPKRLGDPIAICPCAGFVAVAAAEGGASS
jgi:hypothetical protein